jgi:hypothetical protein
VGSAGQCVDGRRALAISSGGAPSSYETTVLLSVEEMMEAHGKAKSVRYRPPGA